jgi:hypothetical protein
MTMVIDGSLGLTFPDTSKQYNSYYNFKNRIINGAMVIDQRNAGAAISSLGATATYTVDRFYYQSGNAGRFSAQQNAGSVTPPAGFTRYLGFTSLGANTPASGDFAVLAQAIEGFNAADLAWGTASASTVTLSFWVRSSITGTQSVAIINGSSNRSYSQTYTISAANTWEQKVITIPGDTSGTWATDNTAFALIRFPLGTGSSNLTTPGAWNASNSNGATGTVAISATNGATFYITGVQLEKGTQATSFDYRPYGQELALCQRYYQQVGHVVSTATQWSTVALLQPMRTTPTIGTVTFDGGTGATFATLNVSVMAAFTKLYQATNHNQVAQANIPVSAEL